ncbi:cbb3-type cytochrome c oxidase subunit II [Anaeromyxobacter sp. Fw109-5]|uniref:cbb3-type cytochrome c oxidase subunit II n=1 Tax=Anaeromyxobacter sp. (strain Fw109-5) TaxID=404589 RepID=UPI0000ED8027|nr:cbb3-type cytochrome c oxidase subunit II [Anaeromyxobacter sp. Fw109-5]ABS25427.1 cytochrome c oxidase, cbb3-type, subunit II [Anaeromyxobacter sp. Fw109-5]
MAGKIYSKPIVFSVAVTLTVLAGSIAMMAYPMFRSDMHPKVEGLVPLTALELAGRHVYQREGCVNCHTQTVRPLQSEVVRYKGNRAAEPSGRYSLAGEFAYDHPFLWGSKRTGPDLAFEGWLKSAAWQYAHFENPQAVVPRSNMPAYAFLKARSVDAEEMRGHMRALRGLGVPYTEADLAGAEEQLRGKTEMDAIVAYMLSLGKAVDRGGKGGAEIDLEEQNPVATDVAAIAKGRQLFDAQGCGACHGDEAQGQEGVAPSLIDDEFLGAKGDLPDAAYFGMIKGGSDVKQQLGRPGLADGGMQPFGSDLSDEDIWSIVAWLRNQKGHEASEGHHDEAAEHGNR